MKKKAADMEAAAAADKMLEADQERLGAQGSVSGDTHTVSRPSWFIQEIWNPHC